jgi:hypothetical protein
LFFFLGGKAAFSFPGEKTAKNVLCLQCALVSSAGFYNSGLNMMRMKYGFDEV